MSERFTIIQASTSLISLVNVQINALSWIESNNSLALVIYFGIVSLG